MSTQTVGVAVAVRQKQDQVIDWVRAQQDEIAMVAATHVKPSAIVRVAHGALRRNDKLMQAAIANPQSLLYALLDAARLGHEPDTDDYYLVPFGDEVTGIEGYKGIIERMYRAGGVETVVAEVVRQTDVYRPRGSTTPPVHEYDDFASPGDRGQLRGAYAYALWPGGRCSQVIRMGRAEIMEHKAKSRGAERDDSPWQLWEAAMWKKTVLRALEPYVPTSTEYRTAVAAAAQQPATGTATLALPARPTAPDAATDIVDAEIVDDAPRQEHAPPTPAPAAAGTGSTTAPAPAQAAPASRPQPAGKAALDKLASAARQLEMETCPDDEVTALYEWVCGGTWTATVSQVSHVTSYLTDHLKAADGDTGEAFAAVWQQYRAARDGGHG